MPDALLSIAAGASQLCLLEAAKRKGLAVVAVDRDPEAPGFALADRAVVASTHDADEVLRALHAMEGGIDGAGTLPIVAVATKSSGPPVATTARVAAALGLPGLNVMHADDVVHKPGQLALCERAGVPVPWHMELASPAALADLALTFPLVCKPARPAVGKRAVCRVDDPRELEEAVRNASAASGDGSVELEQFLPGHDVILVGLFRDSRFEPLALIDEDTRFLADRSVRGLGLQVPSHLSGQPQETAMVRHAQRLVAELALGTGLVWLTFRVCPSTGQAHVLELHFDLAGDGLVDVLLPHASDMDLLEATIDLLRGSPRDRCARPALRPSLLRFVFADDVLGASTSLEATSHAQRMRSTVESLRALSCVQAVDVRAPQAAEAPDTRLGYVLGEGSGPEAEAIDRVLGRSPSARQAARESAA